MFEENCCHGMEEMSKTETPGQDGRNDERGILVRMKGVPKEELIMIESQPEEEL
jgi:hypothetical protein